MDTHKKIPEPSWVEGSLLGLNHCMLALIDQLQAKGHIDPKAFEASVKDFEKMTISLKATEVKKGEPVLDAAALEVMQAVQTLAIITASVGKERILGGVTRSIARENEKKKTETEGNNEQQ